MWRWAPSIVMLAVACSPYAATSSPTTDASTSTEDAATAMDATLDADGGTGEDPSLLAHWKLDEAAGVVAVDSAHDHHGALNGGAWASGKIGGGFATGGSGCITIPNAPGLQLAKDATIAAWVNLGPTMYDATIYTHGNAFFIKLNGRYPQVSMLATGGYYNVQYAMPVSEWHHLAVTMTTGAVKIYVDGIELGERESTVSATSGPAAHQGSIVLGASQALDMNASGTIDDVRLWNRVLGAAEIQALAQ